MNDVDEEGIEKEMEIVDPPNVEVPGKEGLVVSAETLPDHIPVLPLRLRPCFPGIPVPIEMRGEQLAAMQKALQTSVETLALVLVRDPKEPDSPENLHQVGVAAKVLQTMPVNGDAAHIIVHCLERITILETTKTEEVLIARVKYHVAPEMSGNEELKAYSMAIVSTLKELVNLNPLQSEAIKMFLSRFSLGDPGLLSDFAVNLTTADGQELQKVLATFEVRPRVDLVLTLLKKEVEITKLQGEISKQIEEKISGRQREFFLKEQLKAIKKELGLEKEGKTTEIEKFQERLQERTLSPEAEEVIQEELQKYELLEPHSPEYTVVRNYLDWLTILPWGKFTEEIYDVDHAEQILERDHFGLEDVKERILEFVAIGKIKGDVSGSILCLVGPPGVGKTSVGKSIAEALGREFYRFSLGRMRDEAEIKGHRRTYVGAMPGKFLQAMKTVGTSNPLIMLDEIDKVGVSFQGDPASALLEVLDPEQNEKFRDHYLDVPFDLSKVTFIATANQIDTIPRPLLDRMEVMRLSGYILEDKLEIAGRYLIPKAITSHGLKSGQVSIHERALAHLIDGYAREAGVRNLENQIRKIMRKVAIKLVREGDRKITVRKKDIEDFLGKPVFAGDEVFKNTPGIVTGLAWTSMGGATLQVEAAAVVSRNKGFKLTGQLGKVMVESADIAYSYVMAHLKKYGAEETFFDERFVHIHVPAGATPKDGPSAGVTMATALVSMVTGKAVRKGLAMTGELTLTGQVLPIGGVKEKVIAARRSGMSVLIFPKANNKDYDELPAYLKKGFKVYYARTYHEVFKAAF